MNVKNISRIPGSYHKENFRYHPIKKNTPFNNDTTTYFAKKYLKLQLFPHH